MPERSSTGQRTYEDLILAIGAAKDEWNEARRAVRRASQLEHEAFWALQRARDAASKAGAFDHDEAAR